MNNQDVLGPWVRVKILGYGGFGQVTLWYKKETEEHIAIKRLQEKDSKETTKNKQMERWCKEVEIMKKLNHLNVVKALNVPPELECLSKLPMLAMEYCGLGDLRQVLNKPENCCGLNEETVIKILRDISSGLAYLHSCKVIHRDLKPDNIVLQRSESKIIYKLIDLGYAKELDQNSLCKSFVGTIQYLAPELFLGKCSSVDYWSFGILAHEIITGYRPFLPGSNPPEWMKQVQFKPRNIISVIENVNGEIIFSSTISRVNHMSRCLLQDIEKWLQLALDWDGEIRGKDVKTKQLVFFDALNEILDKTVIKIFSLPTYEILYYEIKDDTDIYSLKSWLETDTGINANEQILLMRNGKCLEASGIVINFLRKEGIDQESVSLFLYSIGCMKTKSRVVLKPLYVKELLENPNKSLHYRHLKRSCSDSVFFLKTELKLHECLFQAIRVKITNLQSRERSVESLLEDVSEEWFRLESFAQFLIISHKADLENYIQLRKEGVLKSSELVQKWIHKVTDVEERLATLSSMSNRKRWKLAVEEAKEKCKELENNEFIKSNESDLLNYLLMEAQKIREIVLNIPKENRITPRSNTETVKILYKCMECTTKCLRSSLLQILFIQIAEVEEHLTKLVSPMTIWLKSTKIMRQIIENVQKERQKEIWNLVGRQTSTPAVKEEPKSSPLVTPNNEKNNFSPFHIPKTVQKIVETPEEEVLKPDFKIMETVFVPHKSDIFLSNSNLQSSNMATLESYSIISTNNFLRQRVLEMSESWNCLIKDLKSLSWDSLEVNK